jgi:PAS domain S-box-containing protein
MDAQGAIVRANRLTRSLHSSHAGELIGKVAWKLMPAEEQEMSRASFTKALETGEDPPVARRSLFTASGHYRVHEVHRNVIRDDSGKPAGMRVVTVDVTDAHREFEEARRARVWLESVLAALSAAVIVTDALGLVRNLNPAAEELLGWRAEEMIGVMVDEALPVLAYRCGERTEFNFTNALAGHCRGVATLLDRENREVRVEIGASPILNKETGFTEGVVTVLRKLEED